MKAVVLMLSIVVFSATVSPLGPPPMRTAFLNVMEILDGPPRSRGSEAQLRSRVVQAVMPVFPAASLASGAAGVAVAQIETTLDGRVDIVNIMQAPDVAIGQSVKAALLQWRFEPLLIEGQLSKMHGKLTFYFLVNGSEALVRNPADLPPRDS